MIADKVVWDEHLIRKYNYSGPRYTSYPTALEFTEDFLPDDFLTATSQYPEQALSLYVHLPFCHKLCYYCACNRLVTRQHQKITDYLGYLEREISARAPLFAGRTVTQLHWGGGTPTYLASNEIHWLMALLRHHFHIADECETGIEIDPRNIELSLLDELQAAGFNRLSIGVQDFNKDVQTAVNRVQDNDFILTLLGHARQLGFQSTNLDLIYGLPLQNTDSFRNTLETISRARPARLSIFNYAHLPERFPGQRKIRPEDLPSPAQKLAMLQQGIELLTRNGYQYIGMDHFALPDDELAKAQRAGKLHRNFQGYTTQGNCDLLGLGLSSISMIGNIYAQNHKELQPYYAALDAGRTTLAKGCKLNPDDLIRRDLIKQLICNFSLDIPAFEQRHGLSFHDYFAQDLQLLHPFIDDSLVQLAPRELRVSPTGRLLIRNICMCFDRYLRDRARQQQFSRVI